MYDVKVGKGKANLARSHENVMSEGILILLTIVRGLTKTEVKQYLRNRCMQEKNRGI